VLLSLEEHRLMPPYWLFKAVFFCTVLSLDETK